MMRTALALLASAIPFAAMAGERVTSRTALIVRGENNAGSCVAASIGAGSNPQVGVNTDVQNLSVNCSPDGKTDVSKLAKSLPQAHSCWAKLEELEARNSNVIVATDPIDGNPYHCLVRDITPTEMAKALHYKP